MEEKTLTIKQNGQYNNINLKEKLVIEHEGRKLTTEDFTLNDGFVIVEKIYAEGRENSHMRFKGPDGQPKKTTSYSCGVVYKEADCSFWLDEQQHDAFKVLGGVGDKVKVVGTQADGQRGPYLNLSFELVQ